MSKNCSWCGGTVGKYKEFFQRETFCDPQHRVFWLKDRLPQVYGELTKLEMLTKGAAQEDATPKENPAPASIGATTSMTLSGNRRK